MFRVMHTVSAQQAIDAMNVRDFNRVLTAYLFLGADLNGDLELQQQFLSRCLELERDFILSPLGFETKKAIWGLLKALSEPVPPSVHGAVRDGVLGVFSVD